MYSLEKTNHEEDLHLQTHKKVIAKRKAINCSQETGQVVRGLNRNKGERTKLDFRNSFLNIGIVKHCNSSCREVVDSPVLNIHTCRQMKLFFPKDKTASSDPW